MWESRAKPDTKHFCAGSLGQLPSALAHFRSLATMFLPRGAHVGLCGPPQGAVKRVKLPKKNTGEVGRMSLTQSQTRLRRYSRMAATMPFVWLCLLIVSFAYELPLLQLTAFDRANPRLFDVVFVLGLPLLLRKTPEANRNKKAMPLWAGITYLYCICGALYYVIVPEPDVANFCLYFAARYLQGLIVLVCALKVPLNEKRVRVLIALVIAGGVFVALYCIPEYLLSGSVEIKQREISGGKIVRAAAGTLFGPLSPSYFHVGTFSTLSFAVALAAASRVRNGMLRWSSVAASAFVAWPAVFCGSRAALFGVVIVSIWMCLTTPKARAPILTALLLAASWFTVGHLWTNVEDLAGQSLTVRRMFELESSREEEGYSTEQRVLFVLDFTTSEYVYGAALPWVGAGFYVAPVGSGSDRLYRVGFGAHNMYLFPLEQGGILAAVLFLLFLRAAWVGLGTAVRFEQNERRTLAVGVRAFFCAMLLMGLGGQIFWYMNEAQNMSQYILVLLLLASVPKYKRVIVGASKNCSA